MRNAKTIAAMAVIAGFLSWFVTVESETVSASPGLSSPDACTGDSCDGRLTLSDKKLPYFRNYPLGTHNDRVTAAVVMVHGIKRDADQYFDTTIQAATNAGAVEDTVILAPGFQDGNDAAGDELWWEGTGWSQGDKSNNSGTKLSSFAVMDQIVARLADRDRFPNLRRIVIAGHSAGGQFVQRYAIGTQADKGLPAGTSMKFIVGNPSTYAYLSDVRPRPTVPTEFAAPWTWITALQSKFTPEFETVVEGADGYPCIGTYNDWRYGLNGRNSYMSALSASELRTNYLNRDVTYFLGTDDTGADDNLSVNCSAMLQGPNRFERGKSFYEYMKQYYPANKHRKVENIGTGHNGGEMYDSIAGRFLLFNRLW